MATQTLHYHLTKPASADRVAVGDMNDNSDTIDGYLFQANERADQLADDYNTSSTYNTGDYVRRENYLYKCNSDNTTGTWDATKWDRVKVMGEISQGGGGGSSTLAGLSDVDLSSPTDGQLLAYNATTGKWENVTGGGGGGSTTFAGLNDVNVQGVQNGDIARYNSTTGKWTDSSDLTDLELSVSQLSSSVLSIAGDVDTLELTVSQMSASKLPYDANTSIKQKIDEISIKKYSTTEQVVGTWTNGKPLYEKSYVWTSTEITSETINLPIDLATIGADVVFIESGYMIDFNNNICPIPYSHPEAMYNVGVFIQSSKANVGVRASTGRAIKYLSLTIRYTKSAD